MIWYTHASKSIAHPEPAHPKPEPIAHHHSPCQTSSQGIPPHLEPPPNLERRSPRSKLPGPHLPRDGEAGPTNQLLRATARDRPPRGPPLSSQPHPLSHPLTHPSCSALTSRFAPSRSPLLMPSSNSSPKKPRTSPPKSGQQTPNQAISPAAPSPSLLVPEDIPEPEYIIRRNKVRCRWCGKDSSTRAIYIAHFRRHHGK